MKYEETRYFPMCDQQVKGYKMESEEKWKVKRKLYKIKRIEEQDRKRHDKG